MPVISIALGTVATVYPLSEYGVQSASSPTSSSGLNDEVTAQCSVVGDCSPSAICMTSSSPAAAPCTVPGSGEIRFSVGGVHSGSVPIWARSDTRLEGVSMSLEAIVISHSARPVEVPK